MGRLGDAKRKYDKTRIPKKLSKRVQAAVEESGARKREREKVVRVRRGKVLAGEYARTAAGLTIMFTTALNTSTAFVDMAARLLVVGDVMRLLAFRSCEKDEGDWKISMKISNVEMIAAGTNGPGDSLSQEIHELYIRYGGETQQWAMEYKKASMETGGIEEEWAAHNIGVNVWYEIRFQTEDYLSFAITGAKSWTSAYSETRCYPIDLKSEKLATLQMLLEDECVRKADESVQTAVRKRQETEGIEFWAQDEGGLSGIDENTKFYANGKGNPVIVFDKYEIAPGAYGAMEFEVER